MKRATLSRRMLAGVAGLAIGFGGAIALTAPAHASVDVSPHGPVEVTKPTCDDDNGYITIPKTKVRGSQYYINGESADQGEHAFGPGTYEIERKWLNRVRFSTTVTLNAAQDCEQGEGDEGESEERRSLIKEPDFTAQTCDEPAHLVIPEAHRLKKLFTYKLNGDPVKRASTHDLEPGTHQVKAYGKFSGKKYKSWTYEVTQPETCAPEVEPTEPPVKEEEENGEGGGELPVTGSQTVLVAGAALLLLSLGGGMYMLARRRRISFTA